MAAVPLLFFHQMLPLDSGFRKTPVARVWRLLFMFYDFIGGNLRLEYFQNAVAIFEPNS